MSAPKRDGNGRLVPGTGSLNPGGRPKGNRQVRKLAQDRTELAIKTLADICGDTDASDSARVSAAAHLLDRAWGRPAQSIELSGEGRDLSLRVEIVKAPEGD